LSAVAIAGRDPQQVTASGFIPKTFTLHGGGFSFGRSVAPWRRPNGCERRAVVRMLHLPKFLLAGKAFVPLLPMNRSAAGPSQETAWGSLLLSGAGFHDTGRPVVGVA
jgi:hypothetical protein